MEKVDEGKAEISGGISGLPLTGKLPKFEVPELDQLEPEL